MSERHIPKFFAADFIETLQKSPSKASEYLLSYLTTTRILSVDMLAATEGPIRDLKEYDIRPYFGTQSTIVEFQTASGPCLLFCVFVEQDSITFMAHKADGVWSLYFVTLIAKVSAPETIDVGTTQAITDQPVPAYLFDLPEVKARIEFIRSAQMLASVLDAEKSVFTREYRIKGIGAAAVFEMGP